MSLLNSPESQVVCYDAEGSPIGGDRPRSRLETFLERFYREAVDPPWQGPCLLFALRRESQALWRGFRSRRRIGSAPCRAWFCGRSWLTVLLAETGLGPRAMSNALHWLLGEPLSSQRRYRPQMVLSVGFSGALQDSYRVGDVILATEVADGDGNCWPANWPNRELPSTRRLPLHFGRLLTMPRLIGDPAEKLSLGQQHQAAAVDMETAVVARLCSERGVPFGCIRAVSDDLHTSLSPRLVSLLDDGRVSASRLLAAVVRRPRLVGELWRLARHTRLAAEQLGKALAELLTLTLPGPLEPTCGEA